MISFIDANFVYYKCREEHEYHLRIMLDLLEEKQLYAKYSMNFVAFGDFFGPCGLERKRYDTPAKE